MDTDKVLSEFRGGVLLSRLSEADLESLKARGARRVGPAPVARSQANRAVVEGWADFLSPHFANGGACNLTGTYSDGYGYSHGLMAARNVIKDFQAFRKSLGRSGPPACIGVERHPSGRDVLHFHALLGGEWGPLDRELAVAVWSSRRGWCVAREVVNREGCVAYAAKHLLKQKAEDHFEFWLPPEDLGSRYARRRAAGKGVIKTLTSPGSCVR